MEHRPITQTRRSRRSNVLQSATIEVSGLKIPVKLRNLSADGALIEGERLPVEGTVVLFHRNDLTVDSRIAWVAGCHAGVAFTTKLQPQEVLRHIPQTRPLTEEERRAIERWVWSPSPRRLGD